MKKKFNKILSIFILISLITSQTISIAYAAPGNVTDATNESIIYEDEDIRIAEMWEAGVCYRAEYNKVENYVTVYEIVDNQVVKTIDISFDGIEYTNSAGLFALPPEGTFAQAELGFGYLIGEYANTFACSYELVENGTYEYQGIRVHENVEPDLQELFTTSVDDLIILEQRLQIEVGLTLLSVFFDVVLVCFGNPWAMVSVAYTAVSGIEPANDLYSRVYNKSIDCGEYYQLLFYYRIPPV